MLKIIGVAANGEGKGKDTFAEMLKAILQNPFLNYEDFVVNKYTQNDSVKIIGFSDGVKEIVSILSGISAIEFENRRLKESYCEKFKMTYRNLLIHVGMGFRQLNEEVWIDDAFKKINSSTSLTFIIKDVRFDNEIIRIKKEKGIVVRLHRGLDNVNSVAERGISIPLCVEIDNNNSLEDLFNEAKKILKTYYVW
jgi:hypothetical protein